MIAGTPDVEEAKAGREGRQAALRQRTRKPGIKRTMGEDGFEYHLPDGRRLTDEDEIARIRKLAIPPAYPDVWICRDRNGHLQATGRDARGRKQYRYHARWRDGAGRGEVSPDAGVRAGAAQDPGAGGARPGPARAAAAPGAGGGGEAAGEDAGAGRQRGIRARQPELRPDDAAQPAHAGGRQPHPVRLPRQARHRPPPRPAGPPAGQHRQAVPGAAGPAPVPVRRPTGRSTRSPPTT